MLIVGIVERCQGVPALIPYDGDDPTPPGFQLYNLYVELKTVLATTDLAI